MDDPLSKHAAQPTILFVEDSEEDFAMFVRLIDRQGLLHCLQHSWDGDEALDYLYGRGDYGDRDRFPLPSLIVLDLNLPGIDGRDVLKAVKNDPTLKCIPIAVLSTSSNPSDINDCYRLGASGYLVKSMHLERLRLNLNICLKYWLDTVHLPVSMT